ncbi:hypothetical protein ACLF3G_27195 [Falsiroseomonas sp. HC035]|uniref:hypothetical protein n=1 Tax=Falsiroseomonas sp. HC035 TaxID=3390999 RepID=UPI003D3243B1
MSDVKAPEIVGEGDTIIGGDSGPGEVDRDVGPGVEVSAGDLAALRASLVPDNRPHAAASVKGGCGKTDEETKVARARLITHQPVALISFDPDIAVEDSSAAKMMRLFPDVKVRKRFDLMQPGRAKAAAAVRAAITSYPGACIDTKPTDGFHVFMDTLIEVSEWNNVKWDGMSLSLVLDPSPQAVGEIHASLDRFEELRGAVIKDGRADLLERKVVGEGEGRRVRGLTLSVVFQKAAIGAEWHSTYTDLKVDPAGRDLWKRLQGIMVSTRNPEGWMTPCAIPMVDLRLAGMALAAEIDLLRAWNLGPAKLTEALVPVYGSSVRGVVRREFKDLAELGAVTLRRLAFAGLAGWATKDLVLRMEAAGKVAMQEFGIDARASRLVNDTL